MIRRWFCLSLVWCVALGLRAGDTLAPSSVVRIQARDGGSCLERNGALFFIKGAVGSYRLDLLAA
ncbi:MAG TPA: hypothetical protein P5525_20405, partial [Candidatus Paceibacterota bacterium]|nr:hypothetical protein [Candidatus Paceibacterota bacterium]